VRFILRGSLQQLTSGFYEGLKLKWEILTTAHLNGTINRNFNSFYGKFRGIISFFFGNFLPLRGRVFSKFRNFEISYISYVFFNFEYYSKVATISRK
jgi:hypothetical protein